MEYRLSIKDTDYNSPALDWLRCGQKMGWVKVVEQVSSLQLPDIDLRMQKIFHELEAKKIIKHKYDYAWIMQLIDEKKIEEVAPFKTVPSFRSYLLQLGIEVAGVSTLSQYYNTVTGDYPNWEFTDTDNRGERLRRINVAGKFYAAYLNDVNRGFSEDLSE
ncbi:hypothetical protein [Prevotella sp. tc2-28]|uniref:hypothetical protein n=1 Tax=Prevotella sp. tc2-28 TaxID=1761888 RepID=UPI001160052C|nr:hypothetical protein [Prevotella sp. tc2-28]